MADYDFPTLLEGTGPTLDAKTIMQAQAQGNWSRTFGPGNNLMTRKRYNADMARETAVMQAAQEQQLRAELLSNKDARDLYYRGKKLEMDKKLGEATLDLREQKFNHDEQLFPEKLATEQARTQRLLSQDRLAVKKARTDEELTTQRTMDEEAFLDNVRASGARPGSQEFMDEMVKNRTNFPGSTKAFNDMFKAHSGSTKDPEEFYESRKTALAAAGPNTTVTTKLPGGVTVTDRPVNASAERTFAANQLQRAQARKDRATKAEDDVTAKEADEDIAQWSSRLGEADAAMKGGAPAAAASASHPTVTSAADFSSLSSGAIFIDPNGVRRRKP